MRNIPRLIAITKIPLVVFLSLVVGFFNPLGTEGRGGRDVRRLHLPAKTSLAPLAADAENSSADPRAAALAAQLREQHALRQTRHGRAAMAPQIPPEQQDALVQLREWLGTAVEMRVWPQTGTPRHLKAPMLERAARGGSSEPDRDERTARAFFRTNRALLRLDDPDRELAPYRHQTDELGRRHLRFAQWYGNIPIWPAELIVHLDPAGNVELLNGGFVPTPRKVSTHPTVDAQTALARARAAIPGGAGAVASIPRLIIYAPGDRLPRLAWKLELTVSLGARWVVVIDAAKGTTLTAFNHVMDADVAGSGADLFGIPRPLHVWGESGAFFMVDTSKPMFEPASDPPAPETTRGAIVIRDARNLPPTSTPQAIPPTSDVTSESAAAGWLRDAVSAAFNLAQTYDYYLERHGRNSLDGQGSSILAIVRLGQYYQNAFFDPQLMLMAFGDGRPYAGALDVVAHELTHGITLHTANLLYQDQPGALNEAFSDIFGELVEARTTSVPDWINGAQLGNPASRRNLAAPASVEICPGCGRYYPAKMSEFIHPDDPFLNLFSHRDNGGVHINSSIINHAFYLLAQGLDGAMGLRDAERIFYRALTVHLVANSQFLDARLACIQAAEELFGPDSPQALKTAEAFDAVEIVDGMSPPEPPPPTDAHDPDATLFVFFDPTANAYFLGRREEALGDGAMGMRLSTSGVVPTRPAVAGDGSFAIFVNAANDVCFIDTDGRTQEACLGFAGQIYAVAMSPDGRRYGFVLLDTAGNPEPALTVISIGPGSTSRTLPLRPPAIDGVDHVTVLFADAMDFTADGQMLLYDALNTLQYSDGTQLEAWGIYAIDLATDTTLTIAPPCTETDFAFPVLSRRRNGFVTFDSLTQATGRSTILAGNLHTREFAEVTSVKGFGLPSYTGDDTAIIYAKADTSLTGASLWRQPLAEDGVTPRGSPTLWLRDASYGALYRRGTFLSNLSTRGRVETGDAVLIAGFIIADGPKTVLIRALGPSLGHFGVPGVLADPTVELLSGQTVLAVNDNWTTGPQAADITAGGLAPPDTQEAALIAILEPGEYTAIVRGAGDDTGVGLVEVYDVDSSAPRLINISTRGVIGTDDDVLIAGFIVTDGPKTVLIRALGPSLAHFGVSGGLADPTVELLTGQTVLMENDNWTTHPRAADIVASGFAPPDAQEAALIITLAPGAYTAIVRGAGNTTGVGLVEVFELQ